MPDYLKALTGTIPRSYIPSSVNGIRKEPLFSKTKSISYGTSDQIYALTSSAATDAPSGSIPSLIELTNVGTIPLVIMVGYKSYSTETAIADSGATRYFHSMLMAGETYYPNVRGVISTATATTQFDGTAVENTAPDSNEYTDSTANVDDGSGLDIIGSASETKLFLEPYTSDANCTANLFRIGDLIRVNDEIMEVAAIGDKTDLANNYLTVIRGLYGSTAASDHADTAAIRFPFFNAYHDFDKYSVAQTDNSGKFKCYNFFGLGRAATGAQGLIPGSVAIKFYQSGYQELGLSGITASTNSGLTAGETLKLDITVDGGTLFQDLTFTLDSSNVNFGGTNGVLSKIQSALDTQYYTAGNLFEKKVTVGIVGGDIRFTSGSHLSTSAILLADTGDSDTFIDAAANGRIPGSGDIDAPVAARLPDDVVYDGVTYATSPSGVFCYDDGFGRLTGMGCSGSVNYETGAIDFTGAPPNAEFVYSVSHTSAFSGKLADATTARGGAITDILVNNPNQKTSGSLTIKQY